MSALATKPNFSQTVTGSLVIMQYPIINTFSTVAANIQGIISTYRYAIILSILLSYIPRNVQKEGQHHTRIIVATRYLSEV